MQNKLVYVVLFPNCIPKCLLRISAETLMISSDCTFYVVSLSISRKIPGQNFSRIFESYHLSNLLHRMILHKKEREFL